MIDRTRYLACNMNQVANNYSFIQIESALEAALLKIEASAKEGKFECWIYEQDINKKDTTCRMSDLVAELRKLGYDTQVGRDKNDFMGMIINKEELNYGRKVRFNRRAVQEVSYRGR